MGLISGRKAFQRPMNEGVELLNAIQDVYLSKGNHGSLVQRSKKENTRAFARSHPPHYNARDLIPPC